VGISGALAVRCLGGKGGPGGRADRISASRWAYVSRLATASEMTTRPRIRNRGGRSLRDVDGKPAPAIPTSDKTGAATIPLSIHRITRNLPRQPKVVSTYTFPGPN